MKKVWYHNSGLRNAAALICAAVLPYSVGFLLHTTHEARAQSANELRQRIDDRAAGIKLLEQEILKYQAQLDETSKKSDTLENAIQELDISRKKVEANLKVTLAKIESANLTLKKLQLEIGDKTERIDFNERIIAETLKKLYQSDGTPLIEVMLSDLSLSKFWNESENLDRLQGGVRDSIKELQATKKVLVNNQAEIQKKKAELLGLKKDLSNTTSLLESNKREKSQLLNATKNAESNYKKIIADKALQKDQFEQEVFALESQLKISINSSDIPSSGKGILAWPLDSVTVTQYFGNTPFATKNPAGYGGKGHNGIDFRASNGTPVRSSDAGIVVGTSDTGLVRGCYSYGRWIMVKHGNGLSTLYAHLSLPLVKTGQAVARGEVIGYSGNTGYTTGPHLHFGVYLTKAVRITTMTTSSHCNGAIIPISDPQGYLNPLSYL